MRKHLIIRLSLKCGIRTADSADELKCGSSGIDPKLRIFLMKVRKKLQKKILKKSPKKRMRDQIFVSKVQKRIKKKISIKKKDKMRTADLNFNYKAEYLCGSLI